MVTSRIVSLAFLITFSAAVFGSHFLVPETRAADTPAGLLDQHTLDKRTGSVLKDLKLGDPALETKVRAVLEPHFQALQMWHAEHDSELDKLWAEWSAARNPNAKDETAAAKVGEKIDAIYATFRPQHDAFLTQLSALLSPGQIETFKNSLTKTPGLERTYKAYLEIVPTFTDADKAFAHDKLVQAREQAIDAIKDKEKIAIFKRQKVQVEAYIDAHGYDWKTSYAAFAKKMKNPPLAEKAP